MFIRQATYDDLESLLKLYTHLHENPLPPMDEKLEKLWCTIIDSPTQLILIGIIDGVVISSCVLVITPNLTHQQRPYALIENVITHPAYRTKGYASQILAYAKQLASQNKCYKIMLLTGAKQERTLDFCKKAGYNCNDKTAFIQWLE